MWHDTMWNDGWMMHNWGMGMWLTAFLILAVVAIAIMLINRSTSEAPAGGPSNSALDILERRYAEGDIEEEEFHRRKRELLND